MPEIRAVVVDDEPAARRGIRQLLEKHGDVRLVGEARDGPEAVKVVRTLEPDLLFLDIRMPGLDGFGVLRRLVAERELAVVFLTAYGRYAVRAFDVNAVDYLMKPVVRRRFDECLDRVREWHERRARDAESPRELECLRAGTPSGDRLLRPEEIDRVEAADYYAALYASGERFLIRESLASLEARLPRHLFVRTHRSALVNLARVERLERAAGSGGRLRLRDGSTVPVSRRRLPAIRRRIAELADSKQRTADH